MASGPGVLILVENLPVPSDRRVWLEATTLRDAGYQVSVISPTGKRGRERQLRDRLDGIAIYRYPHPPQTSGTLSFLFEFAYCWLQTLRLAWIVHRREGFDLLHACNPPETFFLIGRFYKLLGKRFIFDHHDLSPEMYKARFGKEGTAYRLLLLLERLTFRTADVVISTNESHRQVALSRGGVAPGRVFVVRNGPDPDVLRPMPPDPSLREGKPHLLAYLGVINPQDGVHLLVDVADLLVNQRGRDDLLFIIMGDGDALDALRQMSAERHLDGFIRFTGWVNQDQAATILSTADICVDTIPRTAYSDHCTMNKTLEYMAAGRPQVAFELKETRISAGDAALYATPNEIEDFADKLVELLADPERREAMGALGRRRIVEQLAWTHQREMLLAAYAAAMKGDET